MTSLDYLWFLLALIFVVGLILGAARIAQRLGLGGAVPARMGRQRRVRVDEVLAIDSRTKAVLIRRDSVEHLILVGPQDTRVVETGITDHTRSAMPATDEESGE